MAAWNRKKKGNYSSGGAWMILRDWLKNAAKEEELSKQSGAFMLCLLISSFMFSFRAPPKNSLLFLLKSGFVSSQQPFEAAI